MQSVFFLLCRSLLITHLCIVIVFTFRYHFLDGIGDEDEGDESGETLLGEAGHVLDNVAGVGEDQHKTLQTRVEADPQTQLHVVYVIAPVRQ